MTDAAQISHALERVIDPELNFDIVSLGLVYGTREKNGLVEVDMTLTSPACPYGPELIKRVQEEVGKLNGVSKIKVNIVWEPAWGQDKINPLVRVLLRGGF